MGFRDVMIHLHEQLLPLCKSTQRNLSHREQIWKVRRSRIANRVTTQRDEQMILTFPMAFNCIHTNLFDSLITIWGVLQSCISFLHGTYIFMGNTRICAHATHQQKRRIKRHVYDANWKPLLKLYRLRYFTIYKPFLCGMDWQFDQWFYQLSFAL